MRKSIEIDPQLLADARAACGAATDADTVREGLKVLIMRRASQELRAFGGSEPDARDVPRRRTPAMRRARAAVR